MATPPKYLTQDKLKHFFAAIAPPRDKTLLGLIFHGGLRVGETLMLTVEDVNFFTGRKTPRQKRQVQKLFTDYTKAAGIRKRSILALLHSMAVHLLEPGRGIEDVADHLGHKNIQSTRIYAQIINPLREQVLRELEQHPKIVRLSSVITES